MITETILGQKDELQQQQQQPSEKVNSSPPSAHKILRQQQNRQKVRCLMRQSTRQWRHHAQVSPALVRTPPTKLERLAASSPKLLSRALRRSHNNAASPIMDWDEDLAQLTSWEHGRTMRRLINPVAWTLWHAHSSREDLYKTSSSSPSHNNHHSNRNQVWESVSPRNVQASLPGAMAPLVRPIPRRAPIAL
jgi:hypothetical protein